MVAPIIDSPVEASVILPVIVLSWAETTVLNKIQRTRNRFLQTLNNMTGYFWIRIS
jgi:hypothetical protein